MAFMDLQHPDAYDSRGEDADTARIERAYHRILASTEPNDWEEQGFESRNAYAEWLATEDANKAATFAGMVI